MIYRLSPRSSSSIEKMKTILREKIIHKEIEIFHNFLGEKYRIHGKLKAENSIALVGYIIKEDLNVLRDIACFWMEGHNGNVNSKV